MRDWLRTRVRAYLGTANIDPRLLPHLRRQEVMIARLHEAVTALNRQQPTGIPDNDREHP